MELLNQQFPVVEVIVHAEVARLVDVAQQPGAVVHLTRPVGFWIKTTNTVWLLHLVKLTPKIKSNKLTYADDTLLFI